MVVKIVQCGIPEAWYSDNIGREFEVLPYDNSCWVIPYPFEFWNMPPLLLLKSDCEEVKEESVKLTKNIKQLEVLHQELQTLISKNGSEESSK